VLSITRSLSHSLTYSRALFTPSFTISRKTRISHNDLDSVAVECRAACGRRSSATTNASTDPLERVWGAVRCRAPELHVRRVCEVWKC
jgi:hypothetical protein